jgi:hypothetical protein
MRVWLSAGATRGREGSKLAQYEDTNRNAYAAWAHHAGYARAMLQAALLIVDESQILGRM